MKITKDNRRILDVLGVTEMEFKKAIDSFNRISEEMEKENKELSDKFRDIKTLVKESGADVISLMLFFMFGLNVDILMNINLVLELLDIAYSERDPEITPVILESASYILSEMPDDNEIGEIMNRLRSMGIMSIYGKRGLKN